MRSLTLLSLLVLVGCSGQTAPDLMMSGMQRSIAGDHAGALSDLNAAIGLQPKDAGLYVARGGIHEQLGDLRACLDDYEKAIVIAPGLEEGLAMQLEYLREQVPEEEPIGAAPPSASDSGTLRVQHVVFCAQKPAGYEDFVEQTDATYAPGTEVWIYMNLLGLAASDDSPPQQSFSQKLKLTDPSGRVLMDKQVFAEEREVVGEEAADQVFLRNNLNIPAHAPTGAYEVVITATDRRSGSVASAKTTFQISR